MYVIGEGAIGGEGGSSSKSRRGGLIRQGSGSRAIAGGGEGGSIGRPGRDVLPATDTG